MTDNKRDDQERCRLEPDPDRVFRGYHGPSLALGVALLLEYPDLTNADPHHEIETDEESDEQEHRWVESFRSGSRPTLRLGGGYGRVEAVMSLASHPPCSNQDRCRHDHAGDDECGVKPGDLCNRIGTGGALGGK
jgi:hypothetical protein